MQREWGTVLSTKIQCVCVGEWDRSEKVTVFNREVNINLVKLLLFYSVNSNQFLCLIGLPYNFFGVKIINFPSV